MFAVFSFLLAGRARGPDDLRRLARGGRRERLSSHRRMHPRLMHAHPRLTSSCFTRANNADAFPPAARGDMNSNNEYIHIRTSSELAFLSLSLTHILPFRRSIHDSQVLSDSPLFKSNIFWFFLVLCYIRASGRLAFGSRTFLNSRSYILLV